MTTAIEDLHALTNSDEYSHVVSEIARLRPAFIDDDNIFAHVNGLNQIMPRLKNAVTLPQPTPPVTEPAAEEQPAN